MHFYCYRVILHSCMCKCSKRAMSVLPATIYTENSLKKRDKTEKKGGLAVFLLKVLKNSQFSRDHFMNSYFHSGSKIYTSINCNTYIMRKYPCIYILYTVVPTLNSFKVK